MQSQVGGRKTPVPNTGVFEVHYEHVASLVILPKEFFYHSPGWPDKKGFPIPKDKDPHYWFPRFFINHAIGSSGFQG